MDSENNKFRDDNQVPSTSKKEPKDRQDDGMYDENPHDDRSMTASTGSDFSRSHVDMRKSTRNDTLRARGSQHINKVVKHKKKNVRRGRVAKRKKSPPHGRRAYPTRKAPRKKSRILKNDRHDSVSTLFSRLSSRTGSDICKYCGHHCCGRRSWSIERAGRRGYVKTIADKLRRMRRKDTKKEKKPKITKQRKGKNLQDQKKEKKDDDDGHGDNPSEANQAGSKSKVLSKLFVKTNMTLTDEVPRNDDGHSSITPEMIFDTVRKLTLWRQAVAFEVIMDYLRANYPVNTNIEELTKELREKLKVAVIARIISEVHQNDVTYWNLCCELKQRGLTHNHVTIFWKIYADTMSPVTKKGTFIRNAPPTTDRADLEPHVSNNDVDSTLRMEHQDVEQKDHSLLNILKEEDPEVHLSNKNSIKSNTHRSTDVITLYRKSPALNDDGSNASNCTTVAPLRPPPPKKRNMIRAGVKKFDSKRKSAKTLKNAIRKSRDAFCS